MTLKPLLSLCLSCILAAAPIAGTHAQNYNLPNLGAAGGSALSPMQEHQLGEEIMVEVRSDPTYLNDPETIDYLMRLGYKLVSAGPGSSYSFFFSRFVILPSTRLRFLEVSLPFIQDLSLQHPAKASSLPFFLTKSDTLRSAILPE